MHHVQAPRSMRRDQVSQGKSQSETGWPLPCVQALSSQREEDPLLHRASETKAVKRCESCGDKTVEGYTITLRLCHDCMVDLDEWLERRKRQA